MYNKHPVRHKALGDHAASAGLAYELGEVAGRLQSS